MVATVRWFELPFLRRYVPAMLKPNDKQGPIIWRLITRKNTSMSDEMKNRDAPSVFTKQQQSIHLNSELRVQPWGAGAGVAITGKSL